MRNKTGELETCLVDELVGTHIMCITEHWLGPDEMDYAVVAGFSLAASFCRPRGYGGSLLLVRADIEFTELPRIAEMSVAPHCELAAARLVQLGVTVIVVYLSTSRDFEVSLSVLEGAISSVGVGVDVVIAGDFNVRFGDNDSRAEVLIDMLSAFGFYRTIFENTRDNSCIDNIFLNFQTEYNVAVTEALMSDHRCQTLRFPLRVVHECKVEPRICRPITELGKIVFHDIIRDTEWDFVDRAELSLNIKFDMMLDVLSNALLLAFPEKKLLFKHKSTLVVPWFDRSLREIRSNLRFFIDMCRAEPTPDNLKAKNSYRQYYRRMVKVARRESNDRLIRRSTNPMKTMWSIINTNRRTEVKQPCDISPNKFNNYFNSVAGLILNKLPKTDVSPLDYIEFHPNNAKFSFVEVTFDQVRCIIGSLENSGSKDVYGITVALLKTIKHYIVYPLTKLINQCFISGIFPDALKVASVIPVYKKGDVNDPGNYRPISLLPILSKVIEKAIKTQLVSYIDNNYILNECQHGFRKNHTTTEAILSFVDYTMGCFESGLYSASIFCDLSKAFDCVSHAILISKLSRYNFDRSSITLINSYLTNRSQVVCVDGMVSEKQTITAGVPQGSILGPVLFLLYINDLPGAIAPSRCILYADDTTLLASDGCLSTLLDSCGEIEERAQRWFSCNQLCLNSEKTVRMVSSTRDLGVVERNPPSAKFLGVYLDPHLRWDVHVGSLAKQIAKYIYALRQLSNSVSESVLKTTYFALIHSRLTYAILVWGHCPGAKRIFSLQRRAIRVVAGVGYRDETFDHFRRLRILTLPSAYALQCLIYMYNNQNSFIHNGDLHSYSTRNRNMISLEYSRLTRAQTGTSNLGKKLFNKLPNQVKLLPFDQYKKHLKNFLLHGAFFTWDEIFTEIGSCGI